MEELAKFDHNRMMSVLEKAEKIRLEAEAKMDKCKRCGMPMPDGFCVPCNNEAQLKAEERERDIKRLHGLMPYEDFTLEKFSNKQAIDDCSGFPDINLYIYGGVGVGKTHLATALVRNLGGWVFQPTEIYRKCRSLKNGDAEQEMINKYIHLPVLVIDDIGIDKKTDYSSQILYEIINGRVNNRKKGLILTSNLSLDMLAKKLEDDRIPSRIAGMARIINLTGEDHRLEAK